MKGKPTESTMMLWSIAVFSCFLLFDVYYFVRSIVYTLIGFMNHKWKPKQLTEESVIHGICWTTDLDFMLHMNNARYLRECDFGRLKFGLENGMFRVLKKLGGSMVTSASTIRYRRPLKLFDTYRTRTKLIGWDEKAFYLEQRIERLRDDFVCAILMVKMSVIRSTCEQVVTEAMGSTTESPTFPEELRKWVESNEISSSNLRNKWMGFN